MSIKTILATVDCDICGAEQVCEVLLSAGDIESQVDAILAELGWWHRDDFRDVCPNHPRPVAA